LSDEKTYAENVRLTEPEQLPTERVSQYSIEKLATEFQSLLKRFSSLKGKLSETGTKFGGRVLLIGSVETDFGAFVHFLGREVPIKIVSFKMDEILNENKSATDALRVGFELARRSTPAIVYLERLNMLAPADTDRSAVLQEEIERSSWDEQEILVVASTADPKAVDRELLSSFDRTYVIEHTSAEDRVRVFERILKDRKEFDTGVLADLTKGWGFNSVRRLATSLFMTDAESDEVMSREDLESLLDRSGVIPLGDQTALDHLSRRLEGDEPVRFEQLEAEYPDGFLDQLYLMSVGEDYARTQKVIELLNDGLPLSVEDQEFLTRHPHLLNGTPEDRLTRLLRAKKSSDRLQRIMGK
jgi:SpoVK/Ycf46/Vps4 family AAA+-type ATPase